jgi:hypothetical protein
MDSTFIEAFINAVSQNSDTYWSAFSAFATLGTGIIILISVFILGWQLKELRRATYAQGWIFAMDHLQNEQTRQDRGRLFTLDEKGYDDLSEEEKKEWLVLAERACHKYDCIGVMSKYKMFPEEIITVTNKHSILRTWQATSSLVSQYRKTRGKEFWAHFEWLVEQVKKRAKQ